MRRLLRPRQSLFRDRIDAGEQLAEQLTTWAGHDPLVLGLPRGGVPVAAEVARRLGAELDVLVARKVGAPRQPELAMGAVTADGGVYLDTHIVDHLRVPADTLERLIEQEREVARRRDQRFRGDRPFPRVKGRTVIVVDDGLATGATMRAAVRVLRKRDPRRLIVTVPVGSTQACADLAEEADEVVCLHSFDSFQAVGLYYEDFRPTEDAEVEELLARFRGAAEPDRS
ncbi:MAG TPA: phosphoribosyltransferase [Thermomicrobiales bacterium]|nr:phosphoribosyltransferase [Thermomicrobiales bacterium]